MYRQGQGARWRFLEVIDNRRCSVLPSCAATRADSKPCYVCMYVSHPHSVSCAQYRQEEEEKDGEGLYEFGEGAGEEQGGWRPALATPDINADQTPLASAAPPSPAAPVPVPTAADGPPPPLAAPATAVSPLTAPATESKLEACVGSGGGGGGESGGDVDRSRGGLRIEVPADGGDGENEGREEGGAGVASPAAGCDAAKTNAKAAADVEPIRNGNEESGTSIAGESTAAGQERTRADGDSERSSSSSSSSSSNTTNNSNNVCTPLDYPAPPGMSTASPAGASSATTTATSDWAHGGGSRGGRDGSDTANNGEQRKRDRSVGGSSSGGGGGGSGSGSGSGSGRHGRKRTQPISPSGIRAILKGFSVLPWQFREPPRDGTSWNFPHRSRGATGTRSTPDAEDNPAPAEDPALAPASATAGEAADGGLPGHDRSAAVDDGSCGRNGDERGEAEEGGAADSPAPSPARPRGFLGTRWTASVGSVGTPRIVRSHSMNLVSDIEEGKGRWPLRRVGAGGVSNNSNRINGESRRWSTPRELFGGGGRAPRRGVGGRGSTRPRRGRSASFDHAAILEAKEEEEEEERREERGAWGAPWRMGGMGGAFAGAGGGGWRGVQVRC